MDEFFQRRVITVDDGSGACVECACAVPPTPVAAAASSTSTSSSTATGTAFPNKPAPVQLDQFRVQITAPTKGGISVAGNRPKSGTRVDGHGDNNESSKNEASGENAARKRTEQPSAKAPQIPWAELDVGTVVKIKGQITSFRDVKQIDVVKVEVLRGTAAEVKCWDEVLSFRRDIISKPWVVTAEQEEKCRRDREDSLRRERRKGRYDSRAGTTSMTGSRGGSGRERVDVDERRRGQRDERKRGREPRDMEENEKTMKRRKDTDTDKGLDPKDRVNYPSMAVRRRVVGRHDALGI